MKLYELTQSFHQIQTMIESGEEDLTDTLESIDLAIEDKLENIGKVICNLEAETSAFREEEKRLANKRRSIENNIKNLKSYVEHQLKSTGKTNVKAGLFTYAIQKNPPSVQINDESAIPKKYFVQAEPTVDKTTIRKLLSEGELIPGVQLIQGEGLRIK